MGHGAGRVPAALERIFLRSEQQPLLPRRRALASRRLTLLRCGEGALTHDGRGAALQKCVCGAQGRERARTRRRHERRRLCYAVARGGARNVCGHLCLRRPCGAR
jgi:hypothetical protein